MNRIYPIVFGAVVLVVSAALGGAVTWARGQLVGQPIGYSHAVHVQDNDMECVDCHQYVMEGARATIPNIEVCGDCHDEQIGDSPEEAKVVEYVTRGERIPWQKVYQVPESVYFSHRRHTAIGQIACEVCHGAVGERMLPVSRPAVRVSMNRCIGCHLEREVSVDCVACHR